MNLPPTYRRRAAIVAAAAALAWSVPISLVRADDEATPAAEAAPAEAASTDALAPEAPPAPMPPESTQAAEPEANPASTAVEAPAPETVSPPAPATVAPEQAPGRVRLRELVTIMNSSHLRAGETTPEMVTVMGNALVEGVVDGDCVTVMGNVTVQGVVHGDLVCVGGKITLGPAAEVRGQMVSVGGGMEIAPGARAHGEKVAITIPGLGGFGSWVAEWFQDGLGKARILPHNHKWAWGAAAVIVLINLLFAALFGNAVTASARVVESRPVLAVVNGALVLLLAPVLFVLLAASVIGIPLLPIAVGGLFLCWFIGTIGVYAFCGQQFGLAGRPVAAALAGNLVFLLLYALPIIGFAVWSVTGVMGLGAAVTAMGNRRREAREARLAARRAQAASAATAPAPVAPVAPKVEVTPTQPVHMAPPAPVATPQPDVSAGLGAAATAAMPASAEVPGAGPAVVPPATGWTPPPAPAVGAAVPVPPLPAELAGARATFWPRLFAFIIDLVVVSVAINVVGLGSFATWVVAMIAYHVFFWGLRGTTPAGIVMNLQIVRDDGSPMDYRVALVRALSGVFSLVPAGIGFIWVAFDRDSQSWHDKLAGTSVISVRKAKPLI